MLKKLEDTNKTEENSLMFQPEDPLPILNMSLGALLTIILGKLWELIKSKLDAQAENSKELRNFRRTELLSCARRLIKIDHKISETSHLKGIQESFIQSLQKDHDVTIEERDTPPEGDEVDLRELLPDTEHDLENLLKIKKIEGELAVLGVCDAAAFLEQYRWSYNLLMDSDAYESVTDLENHLHEIRQKMQFYMTYTITSIAHAIEVGSYTIKNRSKLVPKELHYDM